MRASAQIAGLLAAVLGAGCESLSYYPYDCRDLAECPLDNACPGECVRLPPLDFSDPVLLWTGKPMDAPQCPARAPVNVYEGHADLDDSHECPPCACTEPACVLPAGVTASSSAMCQGPAYTSFEASPSWDGACTSPAVVPALGSVTMAPVTARPCAPVQPETPHDGPWGSPWSTFVRACGGEAMNGLCNDPGLLCMPSAEPPPPGFRQCIMYSRDGDPACPADYPDKFLFHGGLEDTRECTPCTCTETAPSTCIGWLSLYEDAACGAPLLSSMVGDTPTCLDTAPGAQLGSMEGSWLVNEPGSCGASGGVSLGEAKPLEPRTFCCQPPPGGG
jgi:hypothetical protein